jgi:serine/threonine protein kinase, bacterial
MLWLANSKWNSGYNPIKPTVYNEPRLFAVTDQKLLSDRYQILQTLGSGGFGETFLAEDTHMPSRRRCVVKKLRPTQNDPALEKLIRERFQREAAMLEELSGGSRQIPALYAYFYSETDQQYYIVQEWIDGDTLSALVSKKGVLDENQVRRILTNVLPVFTYIHSRSIVHRDIKPDNIILRHSDQLPVLIDFGAVREAMGTVINSQGQPTQSIVIGTPGYMPSEQSIGRPVYGSDIYSLGLTAIYLLTGQSPNNLPSDPSSAEILWRNQAPQISSAFAQILDKAISYHHRDRYQNATEFLTALTSPPTPAPNLVGNPHANPVNNSNVATYVVSPAPALATQVSTTPAASKNNLIVGGAIATTIVGGALATALFFNNSGSKVNSPSANNPGTKESIAPTVSISPSVTPTPEIVPSPANTPLPPAKTPNSAIPSASPKTPVSVPSNSTPVTPKPTTATTNPNNSSIDPATTVTGYYNDLNSRNYNAAWSKLPPDLQGNRQVHPAGYQSFQDWWNSVESIEIRNVRVISRTPQTAEAVARTVYHMKNGRSAPYALRYFLVWDDSNQSWQIAKIRN